jgi:hypothetical protein
VHFTASTTVGVIKVWLNGVLVIDQTGINTGTNTTGRFRLMNAVNNGSGNRNRLCNVCCFYMTSGDAAYGETSVATLRANGNTATADYTANGAASGYECIDDADQDGDTTYISLAAATGSSIFDMSALDAGYDVVHAVSVSQVARKSDAGACTSRLGIVQGGSTSDGATFAPNQTYSFSSQDVFTVDPASGVAFTNADVNSLKLKVERLT